jgi:hypothetical protein
MPFWTRLAGAASLSLLLGCATEPTSPSLSLTVGTTSPSFDSPLSLRLRATNADGTAGTGEVQLTTTGGTLAESALTLVDGRASTTLGCDRLDAACQRSITVVATWNGLETQRTVRFGDRPDGGPVGDSGVPEDGGVTDAGSVDAGSGEYRFDPDRVYAVGTATPSRCEPVLAIADLAQSTTTLGLPCPLGRAVLRNQRLLYVSAQQVWTFAPDRLDAGYPANPRGNDVEEATVCRDAGVSELWASPDGVLGVRCGSGITYVGTTQLDPTEQLIALASSGRRVAQTPGGVTLFTPMGSFPLQNQPAVISSGGFRELSGTITLAGELADGGCALHEISSTGVVTQRGMYSPMPSDVAEACVRGQLAVDGNGALYVSTTRLGQVVVVRRRLTPGTSAVVLVDAATPSGFADGGQLQFNASQASRVFQLLTGP